MRPENIKRLTKYVDKNRKPFEGIDNMKKELSNMLRANNSKLSPKKWVEKEEKHEFYPKHPAIKSVERKAKHLALKRAKK